MRILNLIPNLSGGGAERQLSYLAPELVRMGHEVHIGYTKDGPDKPDLQGVILHKFKLFSNYDPFLFLQIFKLIRKVKPDIIHTWILQMDIAGGIVAKLTGTPWIIREASCGEKLQHSWKDWVRTKICSLSKAVVSNSLAGDAYWKSKFPQKSRYIVRGGLPLSEISIASNSLPKNIKGMQLPIILYAGRLSSDASASKNLSILMKVLALVKKETAITGILCGDGPQKHELELLRHELGLDKDVHFTGYLPTPKVWALMKRASIFINLSKYEGCPNAVLEAMACECPLIVSDIAAHREILDDSCAFFVDSSNVEQIASIVLYCLKNTEVSKQHSLTAMQRAKKWSINSMAINYEKIYTHAFTNI